MNLTDIIESIPIKPYYSEDNGVIYCGDCLEVMKHIPDNSVDLVLTDPPYNVGIDYGNGSDKQKEDKFVEWFESIIKELTRILRDGGNFISIVGEHNLPKKLEILSKHLTYNWIIVWYKPNAMQFGKTGYSVQSLIQWYSKGKGFKNGKKRDVIVVPINPSKNRNGHPTPKPLDLISELVVRFSNDKDVVLDPFLGSGTTAVACKQLNRKFIGIEISEKYCSIAKDRLRQGMLI